MNQVISVTLNKLAMKDIERLAVAGILKCKKSELLEANNL